MATAGRASTKSDRVASKANQARNGKARSERQDTVIMRQARLATAGGARGTLGGLHPPTNAGICCRRQRKPIASGPEATTLSAPRPKITSTDVIFNATPLTTTTTTTTRINFHRYLGIRQGHPAEPHVGGDPVGLVWRALAVPRGGVKLVVPDVLAAVSSHCTWQRGRGTNAVARGKRQQEDGRVYLVLRSRFRSMQMNECKHTQQQ